MGIPCCGLSINYFTSQTRPRGRGWESLFPQADISHCWLPTAVLERSPISATAAGVGRGGELSPRGTLGSSFSSLSPCFLTLDQQIGPSPAQRGSETRLGNGQKALCKL